MKKIVYSSLFIASLLSGTHCYGQDLQQLSKNLNSLSMSLKNLDRTLTRFELQQDLPRLKKRLQFKQRLLIQEKGPKRVQIEKEIMELKKQISLLEQQ